MTGKSKPPIEYSFIAPVYSERKYGEGLLVKVSAVWRHKENDLWEPIQPYDIHKSGTGKWAVLNGELVLRVGLTLRRNFRWKISDMNIVLWEGHEPKLDKTNAWTHKLAYKIEYEKREVIQPFIDMAYNAFMDCVGNTDGIFRCMKPLKFDPRILKENMEPDIDV